MVIDDEEQGFNLLDQPWIVVLALDGREHEVSILDLFAQAPQLSAIGGEVPTQAFAITRLLVAFLHRALDGPADQKEWAELWSQRALPMTPIQRYAERVWHRFNLFDERAPFFQVPGLETTKGEVSGLEKIVADVPNGAPLFTTRSVSNLARLEPGEAARWLVHVHAFDPSGIKSGAVGDKKARNGKGYPIGTGWSGQLGGVLAQGADVRQTLLLNLIARDAEAYVDIGGPSDVPPWERDPDSAAWADDRPPGGAIDLYTWQTRRVRLRGDRGGVTGVVLANGDKIQPQNRHRLDPHTAWRHSPAQSKKFHTTVYMPRTHDPNRSVWRGIAAMLPSISPRRGHSSEPQRGLAPGVLQWLDDLVEEGHLPEDYVVQLRVHGAEYGSQSSTFTEIVDDVLSMPVVLLRRDRPDAGRAAEGAVADAEQAARCMAQLADNLALAAGAGSLSGAGDRARETLYAALEQPYRAWLASLHPGQDLTEARSAWQDTVRITCHRIITDLVTVAPPAAWTGRIVNQHLVNVPLAEKQCRSALRAALPLAFIDPAGTPSEATG